MRILQKGVTCSEKEATQGVNFSGCWKHFISIPKSVAEMLKRGCSHAKTLPLLSRVAWFLGKGCSWPEKSPNSKPQRCLKVGLEWIPSQAYQETVKGLSSSQNWHFVFLEEEKMSCPHFEFRYFLEYHFNLILFKQLQNPLNKSNLN